MEELIPEDDCCTLCHLLLFDPIKTNWGQVCKFCQLGKNDEMKAMHKDDLCTLCHQLLYDTIKTRCGHVLCKSCMVDYAMGSLPNAMYAVHVDANPSDQLQSPGNLKYLVAPCPVCDNNNGEGVVPSPEKCTELRNKYPITYAEREAKAAHAEPEPGGDEGVQTITLCIGNTHQARPRPEGSTKGDRLHDWVVFAKVSRNDIILGVRFSYRGSGSENFVMEKPYKIADYAKRPLPVKVSVILKSRYIWVSEHADNYSRDGDKRQVKADWKLDFESHNGKGAMGLWRLKFKRRV
ncbi:uncharacterized protein PG986_010523 [Apiospora aurea]|uniref:RING-type domain-containing protein n=1 Tax=Apiospora aurea TaxID=335848 RepID=A0ABR1Q2G3_9PEZI